MKLGADSSKKTIIAGVLFVVALVMFIRMLSSSTGSAPAPASTAAAPPPPHKTRVATRRNAHGKLEKNAGPVTPSLDPRLHLAELKEAEDTTYDGTGRNIFVATQEQIPVPKGLGLTDTTAKVTPPPTPTSAPVPTAPQINLKFFGFASGPDHKRVFLASGDDVIVASEGEIVQRRYKIVKINNNSIDVLDVLSNNRQTIPLTAG